MGRLWRLTAPRDDMPLKSVLDFNLTDRNGVARCRLVMGKIVGENRAAWITERYEVGRAVTAFTGMFVVVSTVMLHVCDNNRITDIFRGL